LKVSVHYVTCVQKFFMTALNLGENRFKRQVYYSSISTQNRSAKWYFRNTIQKLRGIIPMRIFSQKNKNWQNFTKKMMSEEKNRICPNSLTKGPKQGQKRL
jgi:hypothetical protein